MFLRRTVATSLGGRVTRGRTQKLRPVSSLADGARHGVTFWMTSRGHERGRRGGAALTSGVGGKNGDDRNITGVEYFLKMGEILQFYKIWVILYRKISGFHKYD